MLLCLHADEDRDLTVSLDLDLVLFTTTDSVPVEVSVERRGTECGLDDFADIPSFDDPVSIEHAMDLVNILTGGKDIGNTDGTGTAFETETACSLFICDGALKVLLCLHADEDRDLTVDLTVSPDLDLVLFTTTDSVPVKVSVERRGTECDLDDFADIPSFDDPVSIEHAMDLVNIPTGGKDIGNTDGTGTAFETETACSLFICDGAVKVLLCLHADEERDLTVNLTVPPDLDLVLFTTTDSVPVKVSVERRGTEFDLDDFADVPSSSPDFDLVLFTTTDCVPVKVSVERRGTEPDLDDFAGIPSFDGVVTVEQGEDMDNLPLSHVPGIPFVSTDSDLNLVLFTTKDSIPIEVSVERRSTEPDLNDFTDVPSFDGAVTVE